jgi:hypothetical protein
MFRKITNIALIIILSSLLESCFSIKYSASGASINPAIKTMSVQYFDNRAPKVQAGLSQQFTEAMKNYMESNTNLRLVNGMGDVNFEGTITGYDIKPTAIVSGDRAAQNRFTITVKVKFTNSVQPDLDYDESFSSYRDYESTENFDAVKDQLTEDILNEIIDQVFNKAFVNW